MASTTSTTGERPATRGSTSARAATDGPSTEQPSQVVHDRFVSRTTTPTTD